MAQQCSLCKERPKSRSLLCVKHVGQLRDLLDPFNQGRPDQDVAASVPVLWAKLNATPGSGMSTQPRAPGYSSRPAADLNVVAMRDARTAQDVKPIAGTLTAILKRANAIMEVFNPIGPWRGNGQWFSGDPVRAMCAYLTYRVDELLTYHGIGEVLLELLDLSDQLRNVVGDAPVATSGRCIEITKGRECRGALVILPPTLDAPTKEEQNKVPVAKCPRCHRKYTWLDLVRVQYIQAS